MVYRGKSEYWWLSTGRGNVHCFYSTAQLCLCICSGSRSFLIKIYMESINVVDSQIISHFFMYDTLVTIVGTGNRIRCTACLVNGSWCTIPRPEWIKDFGINEFKIKCHMERTQRRSGGRSISCIALTGWAAGFKTAGVGGRTWISAEGEVGLHLDYYGLFMRSNCL